MHLKGSNNTLISWSTEWNVGEHWISSSKMWSCIWRWQRFGSVCFGDTEPTFLSSYSKNTQKHLTWSTQYSTIVIIFPHYVI